MSYELRNYGLELKVANYGLEVISCELWVANSTSNS